MFKTLILNFLKGQNRLSDSVEFSSISLEKVIPPPFKKDAFWVGHNPKYLDFTYISMEIYDEHATAVSHVLCVSSSRLLLLSLSLSCSIR